MVATRRKAKADDEALQQLDDDGRSSSQLSSISSKSGNAQNPYQAATSATKANPNGEARRTKRQRDKDSEDGSLEKVTKKSKFDAGYDQQAIINVGSILRRRRLAEQSKKAGTKQKAIARDRRLAPDGKPRTQAFLQTISQFDGAVDEGDDLMRQLLGEKSSQEGDTSSSQGQTQPVPFCTIEVKIYRGMRSEQLHRLAREIEKGVESFVRPQSFATTSAPVYADDKPCWSITEVFMGDEAEETIRKHRTSSCTSFGWSDAGILNMNPPDKDQDSSPDDGQPPDDQQPTGDNLASSGKQPLADKQGSPGKPNNKNDKGASQTTKATRPKTSDKQTADGSLTMMANEFEAYLQGDDDKDDPNLRTKFNSTPSAPNNRPSDDSSSDSDDTPGQDWNRHAFAAVGAAASHRKRESDSDSSLDSLFNKPVNFTTSPDQPTSTLQQHRGTRHGSKSSTSTESASSKNSLKSLTGKQRTPPPKHRSSKSPTSTKSSSSKSSRQSQATSRARSMAAQMAMQDSAELQRLEAFAKSISKDSPADAALAQAAQQSITHTHQSSTYSHTFQGSYTTNFPSPLLSKQSGTGAHKPTTHNETSKEAVATSSKSNGRSSSSSGDAPAIVHSAQATLSSQFSSQWAALAPAKPSDNFSFTSPHTASDGSHNAAWVPYQPLTTPLQRIAATESGKVDEDDEDANARKDTDAVPDASTDDLSGIRPARFAWGQTFSSPVTTPPLAAAKSKPAHHPAFSRPGVLTARPTITRPWQLLSAVGKGDEDDVWDITFTAPENGSVERDDGAQENRGHDGYETRSKDVDYADSEQDGGEDTLGTRNGTEGQNVQQDGRIDGLDDYTEDDDNDDDDDDGSDKSSDSGSDGNDDDPSPHGGETQLDKKQSDTEWVQIEEDVRAATRPNPLQTLLPVPSPTNPADIYSALQRYQLEADYARSLHVINDSLLRAYAETPQMFIIPTPVQTPDAELQQTSPNAANDPETMDLVEEEEGNAEEQPRTPYTYIQPSTYQPDSPSADPRSRTAYDPTNPSSHGLSAGERGLPGTFAEADTAAYEPEHPRVRIAEEMARDVSRRPPSMAAHIWLRRMWREERQRLRRAGARRGEKGAR